ncbi:RNA polymerase sigma factor [Demequina activiva]|uniref:DNA-directed RNA polymerase sigma-70 factor n=1 Tax=Demequina activiva TaxID=1582364 RepID=A0A919UG40_9MICO|nr:sigma-70 family RNA polymerase sigma factor [Demequina activiva]GIG54069.1 DNA-directed RNA polymerase sigma-70 factor [Demequina activiva]
MEGTTGRSPAWEQVASTLASERYPALFARARMLTHSDADAEDVVQDALVKTFSRRRHFESMAAAEAYVRRAITTVFLDRASRTTRDRVKWRRESALRSPSTGDPAEGVGSQLDVEAALLSLSPRVRACVVLRYVEDLSTDETAHQLGLSAGAVKRYLSDGRAQLRALLGDDALGEADDSVPVISNEGGRS